MSTEFSGIGKCNTGGIHKDSDEFIRVKAVEAALVLLNSRISACTTNHAISEALKPEVLSKLADNIEAALKNTD